MCSFKGKTISNLGYYWSSTHLLRDNDVGHIMSFSRRWVCSRIMLSSVANIFLASLLTKVCSRPPRQSKKHFQIPEKFFHSKPHPKSPDLRAPIDPSRSLLILQPGRPAGPDLGGRSLLCPVKTMRSHEIVRTSPKLSRQENG
jgi:hypothetical protein